MTPFGSVFSVVPYGTPRDLQKPLLPHVRGAASTVKALPKGVTG